MSNIFIFSIVMIVIGAVFVLKDFTGGKRQEEKKKPLYQYRKKDFLVTPAEHEFFDVLIEILGDQYYVFPQIHLSHFLSERINGQKWTAAFSHINQKSVDFLICDKKSLRPLLAIEVDDKTHEEQDRIGRDSEVGSLIEDAGMLLLRIKNHGSFDKEDIKRRVLESLT